VHLREAMAARRHEDMRLVREGRDATGEAGYRLRASAPQDQIDRARRTRDSYRRVLDAFFRQGYDAILAPVTPVTAFLHDHSMPMNARRLVVDGIEVPYMSALNWIAVATALHAPALVFPAARHEGLPIGVQLIGPERGESRLFEVALAAEQAIGPFPPPAL
jgi:amidase